MNSIFDLKSEIEKELAIVSDRVDTMCVFWDALVSENDLIYMDDKLKLESKKIYESIIEFQKLLQCI
jgi:hypothetical protein